MTGTCISKGFVQLYGDRGSQPLAFLAKLQQLDVSKV